MFQVQGSIGASSFPSRVFPGQRMPGHMGTDQVTVRNLRIRGIDLDENLLMVEGAVPGPREGYVLISKAKAPPRERRGFAGSGTRGSAEGGQEGGEEEVATGTSRRSAPCGARDLSRKQRIRRKKKTMAKVDVVNLSGEKVGTVELADQVFAPEQVNEALLWEAVKHYRASLRQGTHKTKSRTEVAGSGKKLWKQKGTGRARIGSVRSPLWRHGYTVHGPQPRSYEYPFPRKKLLGALRSALAAKLADGKLTVVDSLEIKEGKTKLYREALDKLDARRTALLVENGKTLTAVAGARGAQPQGRGAGAEQRSASLRSAAL